MGDANQLAVAAQLEIGQLESELTRQFVTMRIAGQLFGIPVLVVRDVLKEQAITRIPLSAGEIEGAINLRGRIVTAINMHKRLGVERADDHQLMHVVVDFNEDQYSLLVDEVGEVLTLALDEFDSNPANLEAGWQQISLGVFRLKDELLLILNIENLLNLKA